MKRLILCLSLAILPPVATPAGAEDPVFSFADSDPAMNAAIADARRTLPLFLSRAIGPDGESLDGALVKAALPTVNGANGLEHIWIMPFALRDDGSVTGLLANEPAELGDLAYGDQVDFTQDQISDWSFSSPDGLLYGNYTSRVMFETGAFGDTPFESVFMPDPIPADWK
jgi:uncharacterized protein YegJ (DUF2314 family)